ncbi:MAG TPA: ABC transporter permease [Thermoplasmata archaeon]|nr:ABC transporter permease [Thermoplasmata archaeon]
MGLLRVAAVARKALGQLSHDRRTVVFVLIVPLIVALVFGYGFGGQPTHIATVVVNDDQGPAGSAFLSALPGGVLDLSSSSSNSSAWSTVHSGSAWAAIVIPSNFTAMARAGHASVLLYLDGTSPTIAAAVVAAVQTALTHAFVANGSGPTVRLSSQYVYGSSGTPFIDTIAPGIMALAILFITTVLSIIVLVRERSAGLLERLFASPLRPAEFVAGHALALTVVALGQVAVLFVSALLIFQATFVGNLFFAYGVLLLFGIGNLGLGMLLSAIARNEFQAIQFIPLLLIPQILFAGALFPIEAIPFAFRPVSEILPLTYAARALQDILLRGWGASGVAVDLLALTIYAALMLGGAIALVRRQA